MSLSDGDPLIDDGDDDRGTAVPERAADQVLTDLMQVSPRAVFGDDVAADAVTLAARKAAADMLVQARFATFTDAGRTEIAITNAGRYWALNGGYMAYLKDDPRPAAGGGGGRQRNPEMESLRAEYMKLRLGTFWWSFGLSIAGFFMSLVSVAIALFYGDRLLR